MPKPDDTEALTKSIRDKPLGFFSGWILIGVRADTGEAVSIQRADTEAMAMRIDDELLGMASEIVKKRGAG